jgi:hypothetical protein
MKKNAKYDDTYEKTNYITKIFMYCDSSIKTLNPYVDIIAKLDPVILLYKYGKGQQNIRTFGSQHNHRMLGCDLETKDDYIKNLIKGYVKFIFIFSNSSTSFTSNLMNLAKTYKINAICCSENSESTPEYVLYPYSANADPIKIKTVDSLISSIKELIEYLKLKELNNVFPEFELIPDDVVSTEQPVLTKCLQLLKETTESELQKKTDKKIQIIKSFYDPNLQKVKKMSITNFF